MAGNLSLKYNKEYFDNFDWKLWLKQQKDKTGQITKEDKEALSKDLEPLNKEILATKLLDRKIHSLYENIPSYNSFNLLTTYPGMTLGLGYPHSIGVEGEFKLGFHLDHTSGMPLIPGHSVKGKIRAAFPQFECENLKKGNMEIKKESKNDPKKIQRAKFVYSLLSKINSEGYPIGLADDEVCDKIHKLELILFEGVNVERTKFDGRLVMNSNYKRDIFLEAKPIECVKNLFSEDYLTPHKKQGKSYKESAILEPIPLKFLKVSPNVRFCFQFILPDLELNLTIENRLLLYERILTTTGIGAKTNIGYGYFKSEVSNSSSDRSTSNELIPYTGLIKANLELYAKVIDQVNKKVQISRLGKIEEYRLAGNCPPVGTLVRVSINVEGPKDKLRIASLSLIQIM